MSSENQFSETSFSEVNLEQAVAEIRNENVDPAVVEAAAARVWSKLEAQAAEPSHAIRNCEDFQALIPEYRANQLTPARAMLLQDHLHRCVACRRIYEGRVTTMPAPRAVPVKSANPMRWAAAAVVVAAAGLSVWVYVNRSGGGHAIVQSVNGTLFEVSAQGIRPLAAGAEFPDGVEIRTAPDTDAVLGLRDGSVVEMRERSGMSAQSSASDLTIRLTRGSVIVQAAKRSSGHLYVVTPECRVAVTGTVFGVTAGLKGSRVSVLEGEVHVSQDNQEKVLHPGDQTVAGEGMEVEPVREDIAWSRNHDKYFSLLATLHKDIENVPLPGSRNSSRLIARLPAGTVLFASVPNLAGYLGSAESAFQARLAENPELGNRMNNSKELEVVDELRAASSYLGDEVVIAGEPKERGMTMFFLAEVKRDGFPEFMKQKELPVAAKIANGLVLFSPDPAAVTQFASVLDTRSGGFVGTPFYNQIDREYRSGAGLMFCLDLSFAYAREPLAGAHYLLAQQKEVGGRMEASASLVFDHDRQGIAGFLAAPAPMQSLQYFSPESALAGAFVTKSPASIVEALSGMLNKVDVRMESSAPGLSDDLAASLGGEFALGVDGVAIPVPSWKLVVELHDEARFRAALAKVVDAYDAYAAKNGKLALRTDEQSLDGRTYYMVAGGDGSPLTEAHYTFADGFLLAAPSVAVLKKALDTRTNRNTLDRSTGFLSLAPRDRHANFSAVIYQNLAPTIGPIANLLQGFLPQEAQGHMQGQQGLAKQLSNLKPTLIAAYGEPDRVTVAADNNVVGDSLTDLMSGNVAGIMGHLMPLQMFQQHRQMVRQ